MISVHILPNPSSYQGCGPERARASERSHSKLLMENWASASPAKFSVAECGGGQDEVSRGQVCAGHGNQAKETDVIPVGTREAWEG